VLLQLRLFILNDPVDVSEFFVFIGRPPTCFFLIQNGMNDYSLCLLNSLSTGK